MDAVHPAVCWRLHSPTLQQGQDVLAARAGGARGCVLVFNECVPLPGTKLSVQLASRAGEVETG